MITAQDINTLRQQTGAGMMDCKEALTEAAGDFDKATEILRKKGREISAARADRATTEGVVFTKTDDAHRYGVMLALSCETDFVAKNEAFQQLGQTILEVAFTHKPATLEILLDIAVQGGLSVQEKITELVGKIGENIAINAYTTLSSEIVVSYVHIGSNLGVLVGLAGDHSSQAIEAGRGVAMQIAAMNPIAIDKSGIDTAIVDRELTIAKEQARKAGKPETMLDKIAQGKLNKFFEEATLLNQPFVKNNGLTVAQYLAGIAPNLTVVAFDRISIKSS